MTWMCPTGKVLTAFNRFSTINYLLIHLLSRAGDDLYLKRVNQVRHNYSPTMQIDGNVRYSPSMDDDVNYIRPELSPPAFELYTSKFMDKRRWFNIQLKKLRRSKPYIVSIKSWKTIVKVLTHSLSHALTHALTHTLTHIFTHTPTHALTHAHSLTHTYSLMHSLMHSLMLTQSY